MSAGRDFPRPWVERRYTPARTMLLLVGCVLLALSLVMMVTGGTGDRTPVTPATAPEAQPVPFEVEP